MNRTALPHPPATLSVGQQVCFIGRQSTINHGAVGTVVRMGQILDDCPVVHFPTGTHGPHNEFLIITHDRDLEVISGGVA